MNADPDLSAPEMMEQDLERFLVHDKLEIVSILRTLQAQREKVSLHWDGDGFALSIVLAVNPEYEEMVFDSNADVAANRRLMKSDRVTLVAVVDGVKIQFSARHPDPTIFEGHPALRMRLPEIVLRLQRREYFRIPTPLMCQFAFEEQGQARALELRVADVSLGGLALVADKTPLQIECGHLLEDCRIDLGGLGAVQARLVAVNISETRTRSGTVQQRIGCSFDKLPRGMEALISRYIAQVERDRRSRT